MGVSFSGSYYKKYSNGPIQFLIKLRIKLDELTKKIRLLRRKFQNKQPRISNATCQITNSLEQAANHYQKNGWAYLENVLSPDFHQEILKNWPKSYYLNPPRKMTKSYNTGFRWDYDISPKIDYADQFPAFQKFLDYLITDEFAQRIKNFAGVNFDLMCDSFLVSSTFVGSQVMPHKDGIYSDEKIKYCLNILFFINGREMPGSGGLVLAKDNELNEIMIEPPKLINTGLIYDVKADFYHGFKPVKLDKFRWAISSQFCDKDYVIRQTK